MKRLDSSLITPVYVKQHEDDPRPADAAFYLLASNGLYLCRNDGDFESNVPAACWPTELVPHATTLTPRYPRIPQSELERICGFFKYVSDHFGAEAIALLVKDRQHSCVRVAVPRQVSAVSFSSSGVPYPIGVKYQHPRNLPPHWKVFGDIHSHCEMAAYASQTDIDDEQMLTGLHLVVGRLHQTPPEFHVEAVVDGTRFPLQLHNVCEGYETGAPFPKEWLGRVTVTNYATFSKYRFDETEPHLDGATPDGDEPGDQPPTQSE